MDGATGWKYILDYFDYLCHTLLDSRVPLSDQFIVCNIISGGIFVSAKLISMNCKEGDLHLAMLWVPDPN